MKHDYVGWLAAISLFCAIVGGYLIGRYVIEAPSASSYTMAATKDCLAAKGVADLRYTDGTGDFRLAGPSDMPVGSGGSLTWHDLTTGHTVLVAFTRDRDERGALEVYLRSNGALDYDIKTYRNAVVTSTADAITQGAATAHACLH